MAWSMLVFSMMVSILFFKTCFGLFYVNMQISCVLEQILLKNYKDEIFSDIRAKINSGYRAGRLGIYPLPPTCKYVAMSYKGISLWKKTE